MKKTYCVSCSDLLDSSRFSFTC